MEFIKNDHEFEVNRNFLRKTESKNYAKKNS
jgi:hypothetical protein